MKLFLFFIGCSFALSAQEGNSKMHYLECVEAYYNKASEQPIIIYDSIYGKVVNTLDNIDNKYSWYKIAILESKHGWFKIKNIQRIPDQYKNYGYENHWVKASNFLISVDIFGPAHHVYLYDEPNQKSNKIHKIESFKAVRITETSDLWAMIEFKLGKKKVSGWLQFKDQCAYPWTTCSKY